MWAEAGKQPIRPKGRGRDIMVSDFIDDYNSYLSLSDGEYEEVHANNSDLWKDARFLLKYGISSERYWNSDKFLVQVKQAVTIAEIKYPSTSYNIVFLFY